MSFLALHSSFVTAVYRWIWLGRIDGQTPPLPPGAVVLAAHYNGAVDGFTYGSQLPPFFAVVSMQWHRTPLGRWLVPGIAVQRAKDGSGGGRNLSAFRAIVGRLRAGERLLFFPEGTSQLGLERLPVQPGTLLLFRQLRREAISPAIFFTAARYDQPTLWRSSVALAWVGPLALPASAGDDARFVTDGLLAAQSAACARPVPRASRTAWLAPVVALPFLPTWWLVARLAARTADDRNVIALWKFIFGVPLTVLNLLGLTLLALKLNLPACLAPVSLAGGWLLWRK
jgi:hypothetical protein